MLKDFMYSGIKKNSKTRGMKLLKEYREKYKLTKREMSDRLGMPYTSYIYYEDEAKGMDFAVMIHVAEILKISPQEWFKQIKSEFSKNLILETKTVIRRPRGRPRKIKKD